MTFQSKLETRPSRATTVTLQLKVEELSSARQMQKLAQLLWKLGGNVPRATDNMRRCLVFTMTASYSTTHNEQGDTEHAEEKLVSALPF